MALWAYAGDPAEEPHKNLNGELVTLHDKNTYWVQEGYYVPYYPVSEDEIGKDRQLRLLDDMATDLAKRFFRSAEVGINVRYSLQEIEALKQDYIQTIDPTEKRAKGALLVGATIARMERLAHALIAEKSGGDVSLYPVAAESENISLKEQFAEHMMFVKGNVNGCEDILSHVRLRGGKEDINGLLDEMSGEVFQPIQPNMMSMLNKNRAYKIGQAMGAMDEVAQSIYSIFRTNWPHVDSKELAVKIARELKPTIQELTMQCQRRAGIKSSDAENYSRAYAGQNATLHKMRKQLKEFRSECDTIKTTALDALINIDEATGFTGRVSVSKHAKDAEHMRQLIKSIELIEEGAEMMMDMSELRMSHREGNRKNTTIEQFKEKIADWQKSLGRNSARNV